MNLHELHTPHPLRESDFAAIRARVKAEVAQERLWWPVLLRFAFAAALVVLFVPYVKDRTPNVPVQVVQAGAPASPPAAVAASRATTPRSGRRVAARPAGETPALRAASRIEIITEDPTIRIIWLTPKENNS